MKEEDRELAERTMNKELSLEDVRRKEGARKPTGYTVILPAIQRNDSNQSKDVQSSSWG